MEAANKPVGEGDGRKYDDLLPEVRVLQPQIHRGGKEPLDLVTSGRFSCFAISFQAVNFSQKPAAGPTGKENPDRSLWGKYVLKSHIR